MRLKELREEKGITQTELAKAIQTTHTNIGRWEKGLNEPASSYLVLLADYFDCTIDYLLEREDDLGNIVSTSTDFQVSEDERALIRAYRKLNFDQQKVIKVQLEVLVENKA